MIHSLCEDINDIYSLQILFTVAHIFIAIIVYLMTLVRTAKLQSFLYQLYSILVILNCFGKLTVTCFVCTWIKTEVRFVVFRNFSISIRSTTHHECIYRYSVISSTFSSHAVIYSNKNNLTKRETKITGNIPNFCL